MRPRTSCAMFPLDSPPSRPPAPCRSFPLRWDDTSARSGSLPSGHAALDSATHCLHSNQRRFRAAWRNRPADSLASDSISGRVGPRPAPRRGLSRQHLYGYGPDPDTRLSATALDGVGAAAITAPFSHRGPLGNARMAWKMQ